MAMAGLCMCMCVYGRGGVSTGKRAAKKSHPGATAAWEPDGTRDLMHRTVKLYGGARGPSYVSTSPQLLCGGFGSSWDLKELSTNTAVEPAETANCADRHIVCASLCELCGDSNYAKGRCGQSK